MSIAPFFLEAEGSLVANAKTGLSASNRGVTHRWGGPILIAKGMHPIFRHHAHHKNIPHPSRLQRPRRSPLRPPRPLGCPIPTRPPPPPPLAGLGTDLQNN